MNLQEAFHVLKLAAQHDAFQRYKEASFLYLLAVDMLSEVMAGDIADAKRSVIQKKIIEYKERAALVAQLEEKVNEELEEVLPTQPVIILSEDEAKTRAKEALLLVKTAKELQAKGGRSLLEALTTFIDAISKLDDVLASAASQTFKQNVKIRRDFIENVKEHLRVHLHAKTKFKEESFQFYMAADAMVQRSILLDEHQKFKQAIRGYMSAGLEFQKALEVETDKIAKKVIANRIYLCQKRVERLNDPLGEDKEPPVSLSPAPLKHTPKASPVTLSKHTPKASPVALSKHTESPKKLPEIANGEWLAKVTITDTKTMSNPVDPSMNYTVYMMKIDTKMIQQGKVVDSPSWTVIRRYYQFKTFHSKLKTMKVKDLPDFPPNRTSNVMTAAVVRERTQGFTSFFQELLCRTPNERVNEVCLGFLRNSFKRQEANQEGTY